MSNSIRVIRKLPDAPAPTKAAYKKPVLYNNSKHMRVVELPCQYHPRPIQVSKKKPAEQKEKRLDRTAYIQKRQKWTDEKIRKVIDLYNSGMQFSEIGEKMHCSTHAASMVIVKARKEGRIRTRKVDLNLSQEKEKQLIDMYYRGYSYIAIGKAIGRSRSNVHKKIHQLIDSGELKERRDKRCRKQPE